MVSDFIDEFSGYLHLTDADLERGRVTFPDLAKEAREIIFYGENRDGYWTGEKFISQLKRAVLIAEVKYPPDKYSLLWLFDQSSNHTAKSPDALVAKRMNVHSGGAQPRMRDTCYQGQSQRMVLDGGTPKGLQLVLEERGVNVQGMLKQDMITELQSHADFAAELSIVEHILISRGHNCMFFPKFHCELNPIERVWGQAKRYTRAYCNYSIVGLRKTIIPALESVGPTLIRKYFGNARMYIQAYRDGKTGGKKVEETVKTYKSHRRVQANK